MKELISEIRISIEAGCILEHMNLLDKLEAKQPSPCVWEYDTDGHCGDYWSTSCNNSFMLTVGSTPMDDNFIFCPYCGGEIEESE